MGFVPMHVECCKACNSGRQNQMNEQASQNLSSRPDRLMTEHEAADMLCYSVRALQNWRHRGGGPRFVKVSARSVRYRSKDLLAWIEERTVAHTSE
ncbi:helix-turn-helix domain-containing protein [Roseovarius bejariae]|uniref:helix-turn-helix transcriptional regulator n=1 Tax=Roseovarius bejariae TaxID=2576383 RepID=UPI0031B6496B